MQGNNILRQRVLRCIIHLILVENLNLFPLISSAKLKHIVIVPSQLLALVFFSVRADDCFHFKIHAMFTNLTVL